MEASRGVRPRQKECTCAVDTWATVARGRGATGEATLHGGRESAWTALQLTALHHHLLASKLTLSNTQLISSMPRHPGYDVTLSSATSSLFVADYGANTVSRLDANSGAVLSIVSLKSAIGVALDSTGSLFASDYGSNGITKYNVNTTSGQLVVIASQEFIDSSLWGITVDGHDSVWVCDVYNSRVFKMSNNLTSVLATITVPSSPLNQPRGVAVHPVTGDVYIADSGNYRVVHLLPNLTYAGSITIPAALGVFTPYGVALDLAGRLYVTNYGSFTSALLVFNSTLSISTAPASASSSAPAVSSSSSSGATAIPLSSSASSSLRSSSVFSSSPSSASSSSTGAAATVLPGLGVACPSHTPSPSNPIGCVLYSFTSAVASPNSVSIDTTAQPNTLIVGSISTNTIAVHYLSGAFYKQLIAAPAHPISYPEASTVDSTGLVFCVQNNNGAGYVLIFTPYPTYSYLSVITGLAQPISDGLSIVMQGEYLFVTNSYNIAAYRIACNVTGITSTTLVGQTPTQPDYVYGAAVNPVTGQIGVLDPTARTLSLYTPTYSGSSITFATSAVYSSSNSAMSQLVNARSLAITTGGLYIILSEDQPTLQYLLMYPNGTAASGATPLSGTPFSGGYFLFLAATPSGSMMFLTSVGSNLVVVYQGIDSGVAPTVLATNNSCAAGAGLIPVSINSTATPSSLVPAPWSGRLGARALQQSLYANAYLPALYMIGGTSVLSDAFWQSLDGGVTWSPLGSNLSLLAIPTLQGAGLSLLQDGTLVLFGGVLQSGTAISTVTASSTQFTTQPTQYTAPFSPRYNMAYTTPPGSGNTSLFCAGLSNANTANTTSDCWAATSAQLGVQTWVRMTSAAPFPASLSNAAMVSLYDANSTLLLCGGAVAATSLQLCWVSSSMAATWSAGITAAWGPRTSHVMTSDLSGFAYLYGGVNSATQLPYYDLWLSTDRATRWTLVTQTQQLYLQQPCFTLYYTQQQLVGGSVQTLPQLDLFAGASYAGGSPSLLQGSFFLPLSTLIGGLPAAVVPPLSPLSFTPALLRSECQFTINVAGTVTGFGVSSANPNPLLLVGLIQQPATAASFFQHFPPRLPSSRDLSAFVLQRELSSQATSNTYKASLQRTKELGKTDGGRALAHLVAVSAPRAWAWKSVAPTSKELELTDTQYRLAARLNLDLQPMEGAAALSDDCSLCGRSNAIRNDPWHYLSCKKLTRGEITVRHDDVGRTLHRNALTLGLKAQLEPKGLQADSDLRPDLLISLPGRTILTDVAVCHPLAPGAVKRRGGKLAYARKAERRKKRKYAKLASQRRYEMLPFAVETSGGFAPAAVQLMHAMALAAAQTFQLWTHAAIIQQLVGSVAIAVQRGTAMSYLDGYERSVGASGAKASTCTVEVIDDDDEDDAAAGSGRELVRKRR